MEKKLTASMVDFITNVRRNTQMSWTEIYAALNTVYHFVSDAYDPGTALAKMYKRYMDANAPKPVKETPKPKKEVVAEPQPEVKAEPKDEVDEVLSKMSPLELMLIVLACDEILDDLNKQIAVVDRIKTMPAFPFFSLLF